MMAAPIQRISRLASKTFSRISHGEGLQLDRFTQLKSVMNEIIAADVNFDSEAIKERDDRLAQTKNKAPVSYIHLWEDECFSMGIFIVKRGGRLPLHDHPGMFGLLKVIHGSINIVSMSELGGVTIPDAVRDQVPKWQLPLVKCVSLESEGIISAAQNCCQLTPDIGNFHEITPVTDMAAFLDILAPPYNISGSPSRDCHYYKELTVPDHSATDCKNLKWIMRVGQPLDFWCDSIDYKGPEIGVESSSS